MNEKYQNKRERLKELRSMVQTDEVKEEITEIRRWIMAYRRRKQRQKIILILTCLAVFAVLLLVLIGIGISSVVRSHNRKAQVQMTETESETLSETETETEADTTAADKTELLLSFTGDCILGTDENFYWDTGFNAYYENYGADYFFGNVRDIFKKDDLTIVNFEGTLTEETEREYKQFAFKGDPEFADVLANSSVEAANVANNHTSDYGTASFTDTVKQLEAKKIRTFGYDETAIIRVKDIDVGFFGIYELDDHLERESQVLQNISRLKEDGADLIVGIFHWGNELETVPDSNELYLARLAIDNGVDLIVGHHPHVLQGIGEYKGKTIAFSLGNFCFGGNSNPTEYDTMIFQMKFTFDKHKNIIGSEQNVIPCSVSSSYGYNDYRPTPLTGAEADRVLQLIQDRSDAITDAEAMAGY